MVGTNHQFRPRTNYDIKNRVEEIATELNGQPDGVRDFTNGLEMILRYMDTLRGELECRNCGDELLEETPEYDLGRGKWYCWECEEVVEIGEYLGAKNPEGMSVPVLPHRNYAPQRPPEIEPNPEQERRPGL